MLKALGAWNMLVSKTVQAFIGLEGWEWYKILQESEYTFM